MTRNIRLAALRVPLVCKLAGANLFVLFVLAGMWTATRGTLSPSISLTLASLALLHLGLVMVALRPIRDLEAVASRVWQGDFGARVERSSVADDGVLRVGSMFNILLDGLVADRARMRALATEVIAAGDRERASLARELHDSTAQRIAALMLELSVAARDADDPALRGRLHFAREAAAGIVEEVRLLSHNMHPAVLDDLGLEAALHKLTRDASAGTGIDVDVNADRLRSRLPRDIEAALYRVAQEAVRNATRHAAPKHIHIVLSADSSTATLEIRDDGAGFDLAEVERRHAGLGLMSMRERVALLEGWLEIKASKGGGTTVTANVPVQSTLGALH